MSIKARSLKQTQLKLGKERKPIMANETQTTAPAVQPSAAIEVADRPSVRELPTNFRQAYAALGTGRLVTTGPSTLSGPAVNDGTSEMKMYGGKYKIWATPVMEARPAIVNVDYETKNDIVAPGSIEIFLTESQLNSMQKALAEGFTEGITIQARQGDVAAYDLPAQGAILGICKACHITEAELPFVLLIERPASSLDYGSARELRQGAQLVESGRGHYMNANQQGHAAKGLYGMGARQALATILAQ